MAPRDEKAHLAAVDRIRERAASLPPSLQRVATYIDQNRLEVLTKSALQIAAVTGTSDASVVRTVQALGFDGLPDLRRALSASLGDKEAAPADNMSRTLVDLPEGVDPAIELVLSTHQDALAALRSGAARTQIGAAVATLSRTKRIAVFGLGPSSHLATYASQLLRRHGRPTHPLNSGGRALADQLLGLQAGDAVLMMAYGRAYAEAGAVIAEAQRLGLPIVLITDSLDEKLSRHADIVIPVLRGRSHRVALHGATFVCLEAIILGITASDTSGSLAELKRLSDLRASIGGGWTSLLEQNRSASQDDSRSKEGAVTPDESA